MKLSRSKNSIPPSDPHTHLPKDAAALSSSRHPSQSEPTTKKPASNRPPDKAVPHSITANRTTEHSQDQAQPPTVSRANEPPPRSKSPPSKASHREAAPTKNSQSPEKTTRDNVPVKVRRKFRPRKVPFFSDFFCGVPDPEDVEENLEYHNTLETATKTSAAVPKQARKGWGRKDNGHKVMSGNHDVRGSVDGHGKTRVEDDAKRDMNRYDQRLGIEKEQEARSMHDGGVTGKGTTSRRLVGPDYKGGHGNRSRSEDMTEDPMQSIEDIGSGDESNIKSSAALHANRLEPGERSDRSGPSGFGVGRKKQGIKREKKDRAPPEKDKRRLSVVERGGNVDYKLGDGNGREVDTQRSSQDLKEPRGGQPDESHESREIPESTNVNKDHRRKMGQENPQLPRKQEEEEEERNGRVKKAHGPGREYNANGRYKNRGNGVEAKADAVKGKERTRVDGSRHDENNNDINDTTNKSKFQNREVGGGRRLNVRVKDEHR
jgi:hypothetical protein